MKEGRSLELFFVDGHPEGMLTAEVFNWTGHVLRIPRTRLAEGLKREKAAQTGVYLLLGNDMERPRAYIGESENLRQRLAEHARSKDWWDQAVLITTAGDALHKAHVKYLEKRLIELAKSAANSDIDNGNDPSGASLNEAAKANMEGFLDTLQMVLPAIRVDILQSGKRSNRREEAEDTPDAKPQVFYFEIPRHRIKATAELVADELIVLQGSLCQPEWIGVKKHNSGYAKLHRDLVANGVIVVNGDRAHFSEDFAFTSPSAAAAIISGRATNGRTAWKTPDGKTYQKIEEEKLKEATQ